MRIGKVKKSRMHLGRNPETPDQSCQNGAQLTNIDVLIWPLPWIGLDITPPPPLSRKRLAGKGRRVADGGDEAEIVPPVRLTGVEPAHKLDLGNEGAGRRRNVG